MAEAKDGLSSLVNVVAYGRQRVVLTSRGHAKAALIGLEDLAALEDLSAVSAPDDAALLEADLLRRRILRRRGRILANSADDLTAIRKGAR